MSTQPATTSSISRSGPVPDERDFNALWEEALQAYKKKTKHKLPIADASLSDAPTEDEVIRYIEEQEQSFGDFRDHGRKVRDVLRPIVHVVLLFVDAGAEAAAAYNVKPGGKAIFVAVAVLLKATKGVSELYNAVETLLQEVNGYLQRVKIHFEKPPSPRDTLKNIIVKALVQILMALAIATRYCDIVIKGKPWYRNLGRVLLRRTNDFFIVLVDQSDVQDILRELRTLSEMEKQVVIATTYRDVRNIKGDVEDVRSTITEIKPKVDDLRRKAVIDKLHSWLHPTNPRPLNYDLKKQANSCEWFFDGQFDDWKAHKNGVYWIYGNAGAGKSILSFSIVDKLKTATTHSLIYFHFDFRDTEKQDLTALVASLVYQLGEQSEVCLAYLERERSSDRPSYEQLLPMLSHLLNLSGLTFLVIDALDECPEPARDVGLKGLLDALCGLDEDRLRLIITSRPEPDIRKCIISRATHSLSFHDAVKHIEDLRIHIETQLYNRDLYDWPDAVRATAQQVLFEESKGMFLWVDLQLRPLRRCHNQEQVKRVLRDLPRDLNATYERILTNFDAPEFSIEKARHAFECIAAANRPLSLAEVTAILSSTFHSAVDTPVVSDLETPISDPEAFILKNCPGILDIVLDGWGEKVVQFIHFSALEYLRSPQLERAPSPVCLYRIVDEDSTVLTLARICLSALIAVGPLADFQSYADGYWRYHLSSRNEDVLSELLYRFLHPGSSSFTRWASTSWYNHTALHIAIELGLCHHVTKILEISNGGSATSINDVARVRDDHEETALHIAASYGHTEVARALLAHGALISDTNHHNDTALHIAVNKGYLDFVCVLLDHPAANEFDTAALRCRTHGRWGMTALHLATRSGHIEIARVLLSHGALVDDADDDGRIPLHLTAHHGYLDFLRLLLEHRAADGSNTAVVQCNTRNKDGQTALHFAASAGHSEACRVLLEHGALVDVTDIKGNTPLRLSKLFTTWAEDIEFFVEKYCEKRHPDVARTLLEYGTCHEPVV